MSGEVKRKYDKEMIKISSNIYKDIKKILKFFPYQYDLKFVIDKYKYCYLTDYEKYLEMLKNYKKMNDFLIRRGKKSRYDIDTIEKLFLKSKEIKNILSQKYIDKRKSSVRYDKNRFKNELCKLHSIAMEKKQIQIEKNKFIQMCDPIYFDKLIGIYERKNASLINKELVVDELMKFDGPKTYNFFMKLNQTEQNQNIRYKVFYHLQNCGHYVKLRKEFKGKKESYSFEKYSPENEILDIVGERIVKKDRFEYIKKYDYFISHTKINSDFALRVVHELNKNKKTCYFCWTLDNKNGYSNYLKEIIDLRLSQSEKIIIIASDDYWNSKWCNYEYEQSKKLNKKLYTISLKNDVTEVIKKIIK